MNKGFVIMAQGKVYEDCAEVLRDSILNVMPDSNITIITTDMLPDGDVASNTEWKLQNDYQVYKCSPYEYTIKLEADMYIPRSIDYWWEVLQHRDLVISTTIRNYKQEISDVKTYRKFIVDNNLPDTYNAITYFRKSELSEKFFDLVKDIFANWDQYIQILKCKNDEIPTTDFVYSIASHILGVENTTLDFSDMSMIHMKQYVNTLPTENWTDTFVYEVLPHTFRINTMPQLYPIHYHIKDFSKNIKEYLHG